MARQVNEIDDAAPLDWHIWRTSFVVVLGTMMSVLDTTIVNVALRTLGRDLHATLTGVGWVVTAYLLALAAVMPLTGWTARRFGGRRVYVVSLICFTLGSALCGAAPSTGTLIAARVLQGAAGGMLLPLGQLMMADAAGPQRMGRVLSVIGVPMMLAPVLGPTVGGLIVDELDWRWIFFINVPFGVASVAAAMWILPRGRREPVAPLDVRGLLLLIVGVPAFTYGLTAIEGSGGIAAPGALVPLVGGAALIGVFVVHALRAEHPLLDVRLYRLPSFAAASTLLFVLSASLVGAVVLLPLYLQDVRGLSALDTGLLLAPQALGMAIFLPLSGQLADRLGGGALALAGTGVGALTMIPFGLIGADTSLVALVVAMSVRGMAMAFSINPAMAAAFAALDRRDLPHATPQLQTVQRTGGSVGVALLAVVVQSALGDAGTPSAAASAYGTAFWVAAGLAVVAAAPCVVLLKAERSARRPRTGLASAPLVDPGSP